MRDTVMNEKYFREYILEETGRIKNFQNKLENNEVREDRIYSVKRKIDAIQFELLIARYSSGEDIEKLENDFIQLLNDMPLYWNGNSSYIDMLWMMALAILFDVSREKFGILSDLVTQYNRKDALLEFFVNYKMHGSIEQLEGDYSFGFPYDKLSDIVANKEKAIEFLNLLNTDPTIRNMINYGLEGVHYEKIGDNQIKLINKKGYDVPYFSLGNLFITYVTENEPETKWDEFQDFNDAAKSSPALGFKFNSKSVSTEIAAVNNVLEEFKATIYSGSVDVDEYLEKLNTKLKQQGLDKIIEEMQRQIDEWKASK